MDSSGCDAHHIRPVVGLTTYLQQAQTGVWDVRAAFLPAVYVEGVTSVGRWHRHAAPAPARRRRDRRARPGRSRRPGGHRRPRRRPGHLRTRAARVKTDEPALETETRGNSHWCVGRWLAGCRCWASAVAPRCSTSRLGGTLHQHLPDVVGHYQHQLGNADVQHVADPDGARHPPGRARRRIDRCPVLSPPGHRRTRHRV